MAFYKKFPILILFISLTFIDLFFVRDYKWVIHNFSGIRFLANFFLSSIAFYFFIYVTRLFLLKFKFAKYVVPVIIIIPIFMQTTYFHVYEKFVEPFGFGVFKEAPTMVLKTWAENINYLSFGIILLVFIPFYLNFTKNEIKIRKSIVAIGLFVLLGTSIYNVFSWYSTAEYENSIIAFYSTLAEGALRNNKNIFKSDKIELSVEPESKSNINFIWVIGESQVLSHMSLYGYNRKTTPKLDSLYRLGKFIKYNNAISVGNKTRLSIPYMLTGLFGPDPKGVFYRYPNIFNYAKKAGYSTALISAQDFKWGNFDKIIVDKDVDEFKPGTVYNSNVNVHNGADDIDVLKRGIIPFLEKKRKKPFLLVTQMNGSHYPYSDHSPKWIKKFLPEESPNSVNSFDNSILYTDYYLEKLYSAVERLEGNTIIFFTPDHGQNFGTEGKFNDNYERDVISNALLIFPIIKDSLIIQKLRKNENSPLTQSDIFATIVRLMNYRKYQLPIQGISIMDSISRSRLRTCSGNMPTFHNNPTSAIVPFDIDSAVYVNSKHMTAAYTFRKNKIFRLEKLPRNILLPFLKLLHRK